MSKHSYACSPFQRVVHKEALLSIPPFPGFVLRGHYGVFAGFIITHNYELREQLLIWK